MSMVFLSYILSLPLALLLGYETNGARKSNVASGGNRFSEEEKDSKKTETLMIVEKLIKTTMTENQPKKWWKYINAEPLIFVYCIQIGIYISANTPFLYLKECVLLFSNRFSDDQDLFSFCRSLKDDNSTKADDKRVQIGTSNLSQYTLFVFLIPAAVASVYIGALSDRIGRRPPLLFATITVVIGYVFQIIGSVLIRSPIYWILIGYACAGVGGHVLVIIMAIFSSIADEKTSERWYTIRIAIMGVCTSVGVVFGSLLTSFILKRGTSFGWIFLIAQVFCIICFLYTLFIFRETLPSIVRSQNHDVQNQNVVVDVVVDDEVSILNVRMLFNLKLWYAFLFVLFKKRNGWKRAYILILCVTFTMCFMCDLGMPNLLLELIKRQYNWSDSKYSFFIAFQYFMNATGSLVLTFLAKRVLNMSDLFLISIGSFSVGIGRLLFGVGTSSCFIYLGGAMSFFTSIMYTGYRAFISNLVDDQEQGKIFSIISCIENLSPLLSTVIFNNIYNATYDWSSGFAFILAFMICTIAFVVNLSVYGHFKWHEHKNSENADDMQPVIPD